MKNSAFENCSNLRSITFQPHSDENNYLGRIGFYAFRNWININYFA